MNRTFVRSFDLVMQHYNLLDYLVKRLTSEADKINVAYIACRADIYKVREAMIAESDSGGIVLAISGWPK